MIGDTQKNGEERHYLIYSFVNVDPFSETGVELYVICVQLVNDLLAHRFGIHRYFSLHECYFYCVNINRCQWHSVSSIPTDNYRFICSQRVNTLFRRQAKRTLRWTIILVYEIIENVTCTPSLSVALGSITIHGVRI